MRMKNEGGDVVEEGTVILPRGAVALWFVFPGEWFDVGRFYGRDGALNGWYTNLCTPLERDGNRWKSTDLFLDLWQPATGGASWLDEDEFAEGKTLLDVETVDRVLAERERISGLLSEGAWPPPISRDFLIPPA